MQKHLFKEHIEKIEKGISSKTKSINEIDNEREENKDRLNNLMNKVRNIVN